MSKKTVVLQLWFDVEKKTITTSILQIVSHV